MRVIGRERDVASSEGGDCSTHGAGARKVSIAHRRCFAYVRDVGELVVSQALYHVLIAAGCYGLARWLARHAPLEARLGATAVRMALVIAVIAAIWLLNEGDVETVISSALKTGAAGLLWLGGYAFQLRKAANEGDAESGEGSEEESEEVSEEEGDAEEGGGEAEEGEAAPPKQKKKRGKRRAGG